jgi:hypothetical protein
LFSASIGEAVFNPLPWEIRNEYIFIVVPLLFPAASGKRNEWKAAEGI